MYPTPHLSTIDALNTITPNLADVPPTSIEHRCLEYCYTKLGRSHIWQICLADLPPVKHRCLEYHYTKLGRSHIWQICLAYCYTKHGRSTPHQSSIYALHTITPNLADLLADLIFGRSTGRSTPPSIDHRCLEYHYTKHGRSTDRSTPPFEHRCLEYHYTKLGRSHIWQICLAYCYTKCGRSTPHQLSIHALHTVTPNLADLLADLIFGRSAWQMYPLSIEHRCLAYHYTKHGRYTSRSTPQSIEHRCLAYHYTKLGRSTPPTSMLMSY